MLYVDEIRSYRKVHTYSNWCHLCADTLEELHAMAKQLELKRGWFQAGSIPHYDLVPTKRFIAIKLGAKEVTPEELVKLMKKWFGWKRGQNA